jgi:hypothetical protein
VARAPAKLAEFVGDLLAEGAEVGDVRADVPAGELAGYCLYALAAAATLLSGTRVRRPVPVMLAELRPPPPLAGH